MGKNKSIEDAAFIKNFTLAVHEKLDRPKPPSGYHYKISLVDFHA